MKKLRVVGLNFDHMHMGDLLRQCFEHPAVEIAGVCDDDPARMQPSVEKFGLAPDRIFTDPRKCLEATRPDFVVLCPATARHAEYVELVAPYRPHIFVEKPFAATLAEADRMIAAAKKAKRLLAINWPLRWVPAHVTAHRLVREGRIGALQEVHFYDGNRGPLWHTADKLETTPTAAMKRKSWFYSRQRGGGSLLDYLGYGTTLGTWYHAGRKPIEVTAVAEAARGLEVDEHSIVVARYACGLSKFETRWGTFTDPWIHQPQPKCGFVLKGEDGTISSYDYEPTIRVQTRANVTGEMVPVDQLAAPLQNAIQYFVHCIQTGTPLEGPLAPKIARIGQQIVDSAVLSARLKKTVKLVE
ncbi:MAG: Gfo/Idh/MocA family oxidoreductase [Verrucomicrobia bacterium]|nr:Gfo/Idh/MocA family oxidoreductase [Verrucomicrobiota bacterium]